ncbi:TIGR01777 family oxidoreductase [Nocardia sp. NPDC088792]|uniref:TIGR01777 family oxidoreductase n=1 Tax=Nocardia sp. NPDC088792 TaxID=3364332 RepID=UPI00380B9B91
MGIECSTIVAAPRAEVFDWFGRPGAFTRLAPPWQPAAIESEAESLADGRAVLRLPGGLRWVAQHSAADFDPPRRFVDRIAIDGYRSMPLGRVLPWQHIHEFEVVDDGHTRLVDRVDTPIPDALLRPMFDYRYRQISGDLAAHRRAAAQGFEKSTIAITGASGLVGSALSAFLTTGGHRVISLVRRAPANAYERQWDPESPSADLLEGVDAVIHLAGASIAGRFTAAHKQAIADSRIEPTRRLAELAGSTGVSTFVSAAAIGYYGADRGDELLDETAARGTGFLADVVADWEAAALAAENAGTRVVMVRTGIVQSPRGGTLRLLRPLFTAGLGGPLGDGRQWLSWIGIDDLIDIYHRALWDSGLSGPVNAVAPQPVRNLDYTHALARVLHRPAILPIPRFGPALLLGREGVEQLTAASQRVLPDRLTAARHHFRSQDIESTLGHLLGRGTSGAG